MEDRSYRDLEDGLPVPEDPPSPDGDECVCTCACSKKDSATDREGGFLEASLGVHDP